MMSVKLVVDMNLSPDWVPVLNDHGWQAIHWSTVHILPILRLTN